MRVCDRCGSATDVAEHQMGLKSVRSGPEWAKPLDLCAACAGTIRQLCYVPGLRAADMLRVLDGEPPPAVVEAAAKGKEASGEIPF